MEKPGGDLRLNTFVSTCIEEQVEMFLLKCLSVLGLIFKLKHHPILVLHKKKKMGPTQLPLAITARGDIH